LNNFNPAKSSCARKESLSSLNFEEKRLQAARETRPIYELSAQGEQEKSPRENRSVFGGKSIVQGGTPNLIEH